MGSAFGGSSQTLFGSRGPATAMAKITTGAAVIFMITSITLSVLSREASEESVVTSGAQMELPVALPEQAPSGQNTGPVAPASEFESELERGSPLAPVGPLEVDPDTGKSN